MHKEIKMKVVLVNGSPNANGCTFRRADINNIGKQYGISDQMQTSKQC